MKKVPLNLETLQYPIFKRQRRFIGSWGWTNLKTDKIFQKREKMQVLSKKLPKFVKLKN